MQWMSSYEAKYVQTFIIFLSVGCIDPTPSEGGNKFLWWKRYIHILECSRLSQWWIVNRFTQHHSYICYQGMELRLPWMLLAHTLECIFLSFDNIIDTICYICHQKLPIYTKSIKVNRKSVKTFPIASKVVTQKIED